MRFWMPPLVLRSFGWLRRRWLCVSVSWVAFRHLLPLLVLALGSQSFAQRPSFLEHFVYFVRVFHNVGSVLRVRLWEVLVHYAHQTVRLFSHTVSFSQAVEVPLIVGFLGCSEGFPRLGVHVVPLIVGSDASCHPCIHCLRLKQKVQAPLRTEGSLLVQRRPRTLCCCSHRRCLLWRRVGLHQAGARSLGDPVQSALGVIPNMRLLKAWLAKASPVAAQLAFASPPRRHGVVCR